MDSVLPLDDNGLDPDNWLPDDDPGPGAGRIVSDFLHLRPHDEGTEPVTVTQLVAALPPDDGPNDGPEPVAALPPDDCPDDCPEPMAAIPPDDGPLLDLFAGLPPLVDLPGDDNFFCLPCAALPGEDSGFKPLKHCCQRNCLSKGEVWEATASDRAALRKQNAANSNIMLVSLIGKAKDLTSNAKRSGWKISNGTVICMHAWGALHGVSPARLTKQLAAVKQTSLPAIDKRKFNKGRQHQQVETLPSRRCDMFLHFLYEHLAEPLAECEVSQNNAFLDVADLIDAGPAAAAGPESETAATCKETHLEDPVSAWCTNLENMETKWIGYHRVMDLFDTMKFWLCNHGTSEADLPSEATFRRVLHHWGAVLKIRFLGQHARCALCAELSERLKQTNDPQVIADILGVRDRHLSSMFADRDVEMKLDELSNASCKEGCSFCGRILKVDIDGMDQAKFKAPRNISNADSLKDLWRPALHVVGILIWGLIEAYVLMEPDVPKDSNMQLALQLAYHALLKRGLSMPLHLVFQADNTCRETKNNPFLMFCAWLVATGVFKSVSIHFHRKGHTHGPIDQRFSVLATVIALNKVLQTIVCFVNAILKGMRAAKNRQLMCFVCHGTYDFQNWLWTNLGISTPGITPNPFNNDLHTNHCWRVVRRCDLPSMDQANAELWQPIELAPDAKNDNDAVVLFKEWESSQSLTQRPLVVLPAAMVARLEGKMPGVLPRESLGARVTREFRKTADAIEKEPWKLFDAAKWLREWTRGSDVVSLQGFRS